jgi:hypothetical protein
MRDTGAMRGWSSKWKTVQIPEYYRWGILNLWFFKLVIVAHFGYQKQREKS